MRFISLKRNLSICIIEVTMVPPGGCLFASLVLSAVVSAVTSYNSIGTYPPGKEGNTWMRVGVIFLDCRSHGFLSIFVPPLTGV